MFDKLKSLFVVDDGKSPSKSNKAEIEVSESAGGETENNEPAFEPTAISTDKMDGKINPKFIDKLLKAIEKNNIEGFDYLEYKQVLQNLGNTMSEQTRFESAFAMAKTMNISATQLKESAQYYIDVLKQEENKFDDALRNQVNIQITQRKKDFKGLEDSIVKKEKQIKLLQAEIVEAKNQLEKRNNEIDNAKNKINRTKAEFDLSYQSVLSQIKKDLTKMDEYIK